MIKICENRIDEFKCKGNYYYRCIDKVLLCFDKESKELISADGFGFTTQRKIAKIIARLLSLGVLEIIED